MKKPVYIFIGETDPIPKNYSVLGYVRYSSGSHPEKPVVCSRPLNSRDSMKRIDVNKFVKSNYGIEATFHLKTWPV